MFILWASIWGIFIRPGRKILFRRHLVTAVCPVTTISNLPYNTPEMDSRLIQEFVFSMVIA
jgi:hypothetical protein